MKIKTDKFIILPSNEENKDFIYQTFEITQWIYCDDRIPTSQIIKEYAEKINLEYYEKFLIKCLKIDETELIFNINEFIFLSLTIDFVAKCFIGGRIDNLEKIFNSDLEYEDFDLKKFKKWYWTKSTNLFQEFRESCQNEKLLKSFNEALNF